MSRFAATDRRFCVVVACLACDATRIATRSGAGITPPACAECGYPGWRPAETADGTGRTLTLALHQLAAHPS